MLFAYDSIRDIQVELSSFCNAACPLCSRNYDGGARRKTFEQAQISFADFRAWFPRAFFGVQRNWVFCGGLGDPGTAKDLVEIIAYIRECDPGSSIQINTNGGMRTPEFWRNLAASFGKGFPKGQVIFSIDGLGDTNHLYRRNVDWTKVMANVSAFIQAGGRAHWDFLIFRHNEHQVEQARALAGAMGFRQFIPKKALGFDFGPRPVYAATGELDYILFPPDHPENRIDPDAPAGIGARPPGETFSFEEADAKARRNEQIYHASSDPWEGDAGLKEFECRGISCKSIRRSGRKKTYELYITSEGLVFPCCYAAIANVNYQDFGVAFQLRDRIERFGREKVSLKSRSLREILDSGALERVFADSWKERAFKTGRLAICARSCGDDNAIDGIWAHKDNPKRALKERGLRTPRRQNVEP